MFHSAPTYVNCYKWINMNANKGPAQCPCLIMHFSWKTKQNEQCSLSLSPSISRIARRRWCRRNSRTTSHSIWFCNYFRFVGRVETFFLSLPVAIRANSNIVRESCVVSSGQFSRVQWWFIIPVNCDVCQNSTVIVDNALCVFSRFVSVVCVAAGDVRIWK